MRRRGEDDAAPGHNGAADRIKLGPVLARRRRGGEGEKRSDVAPGVLLLAVRERDEVQGLEQGGAERHEAKRDLGLPERRERQNQRVRLKVDPRFLHAAAIARNASKKLTADGGGDEEVEESLGEGQRGERDELQVLLLQPRFRAERRRDLHQLGHGLPLGPGIQRLPGLVGLANLAVELLFCVGGEGIECPREEEKRG